MNERSAIEPHRRDEHRRLALWLALIGFFVIVQYASRSSGGPAGDPLYEWSFAVGSLIQEGIFLLIVVAIAGFSATRLGLRLPTLKWRAVGLVIAGFFAIQAFELVYIALAHPGSYGNEAVGDDPHLGEGVVSLVGSERTLGHRAAS